MQVRSLRGEDPWRRKWQLTPGFLLEKFHGQEELGLKLGQWAKVHEVSKSWTQLSMHAKMMLKVI